MCSLFIYMRYTYMREREFVYFDFVYIHERIYKNIVSSKNVETKLEKRRNEWMQIKRIVLLLANK